MPLIIGSLRLIGVLRRRAVPLRGRFRHGIGVLCALVRHQAFDHSGQRLDEPTHVRPFGTAFTDLSQFLCHDFKLHRETSVRWRGRAVCWPPFRLRPAARSLRCTLGEHQDPWGGPNGPQGETRQSGRLKCRYLRDPKPAEPEPIGLV